MDQSINKMYQHQDGGVYTALYIATSTVDGTSQMMVYKHVAPFEQKIWARPMSEWTPQRFREISATEYNELLRKPTAEFQAEITARKAERQSTKLTI